MTDSNRTHGTERHAPRAIIHKQILDHADANPEASMEAIADGVSGATTATVERVLERYGDPAADPADESAADESSAADGAPTDGSASDGTAAAAEAPTDDASAADGEGDASNQGLAVTDGGAASESTDAAVSGDSSGPLTADRDPDRDGDDPVLDRSALTEKQRETLRAIYDHPDATQAELADRLGVSSPTISQRVNSIDGFDWSNRHALVAPLFDSSDREERMPNADDEHGTDSSRADDGDRTDESRGESTDPERRRSDPTRRDAADGTDDTDADHDRALADLADRVDDLARQLASVERELEDLEGNRRDDRDTGEPSVLADPELAHKIVHASVHSDRITEEEELRLLRDVTGAGACSRSDANAPDSE